MGIHRQHRAFRRGTGHSPTGRGRPQGTAQHSTAESGTFQLKGFPAFYGRLGGGASSPLRASPQRFCYFHFLSDRTKDKEPPLFRHLGFSIFAFRFGSYVDWKPPKFYWKLDWVSLCVFFYNTMVRCPIVCWQVARRRGVRLVWGCSIDGRMEATAT